MERERKEGREGKNKRIEMCDVHALSPLQERTRVLKRVLIKTKQILSERSCEHWRNYPWINETRRKREREGETETQRQKRQRQSAWSPRWLHIGFSSVCAQYLALYCCSGLPSEFQISLKRTADLQCHIWSMMRPSTSLNVSR